MSNENRTAEEFLKAHGFRMDHHNVKLALKMFEAFSSEKDSTISRLESENRELKEENDKWEIICNESETEIAELKSELDSLKKELEEVKKAHFDSLVFISDLGLKLGEAKE